jgi:hypothetical protein
VAIGDSSLELKSRIFYSFEIGIDRHKEIDLFTS